MYVNYSPLNISSRQIALQRRRTKKLLHHKSHPILQGRLMPDGSSATGQLSDTDIDEATRLRLFAEENGFHFFGNISATPPDSDSTFAKAPRLGPWRMITYGFITKLAHDGWFEIGQLRIDTTSKLLPNARRVTYIKADLGMMLPSFAIDAIDSALHPAADTAGQLYKTESSEFNRTFRLYTQPGEVSSVLKILSPDTMATLIDYFAGIDISVHGSKLFCVFPSAKITDAHHLEHAFSAMQALISTLAPAKVEPAPLSPPETIDSYLSYYDYVHQPSRVSNRLVIVGAIFIVALSVGLATLYALS